MSTLRQVSNRPSHEPSAPVPLKRKRTTDRVATSKENQTAPDPPTRTKKQKLSKTPVKPPRHVNPMIAELKKRIECEYSIRDGGAKLLQASKNNKQSMEVSKGLFVSEAKIIGYMRELQMQQNSGKNKRSTSTDLKPCKAKIAISEIRIPLEWREFEHMKGKMDVQCGVFCLFRIGNQVMDTPTLVEVDRTTMDIIFKDIIIFSELVDPDFTLEIEVYCSLPAEDSAVKSSSTPIKMLKKFRHKDTKPEDPPTPGPVHPSPFTPRALDVTPSHRFALAGHTQLTLKDVAGTCRTYAMKRGTVGANGTASTGRVEDSLLLPIWGQICCSLMAQPECSTMLRTAGFINVQRMVGGLPDWKRLWCVMRQNHMRCWSCPEDVGKRMPIDTIELSQSAVVESAPRLNMRRPNALLLKDGSSELYLAFESREDKEYWMKIMKQAVLDLKMWTSSSEFTIPVPSSKFFTEAVDELPISSIAPGKSLLDMTETIL